jgi:ketosteroid isomerase-like protein
MSQANVEIVRRVHEGWARGDFSLGGDLLAPEFEWHQFPQAVEPGTIQREGVGGGLRRVFEIYEDVRVEVGEFIDAGDRVVVTGRTRARAKGSGMELDTPLALVWTVTDGRLARIEVFTDRRDALEAAGLGDMKET